MKWPHPKSGIGSWARFPKTALDDLFRIIQDWEDECRGAKKLWLCWAVDPDWCLLQQKLVKAAGWTPLVGSDRTGRPPELVPGAIFVDFNRGLDLPVMWMHFPLEFVYRFASRLAFWHSDVLPPVDVMRQMAETFATIEPGEYIGVRDNPSLRRQFRRLLKGPRRRSFVTARRWFEVIGCTTTEASRAQYDCGCGIWRIIQEHPNATQQIKKIMPHYDHGVGIWYWEKYFGGQTRELPVNIHPYHYNAGGVRSVKLGQDLVYDRTASVYKGSELKHNHDLAQLVMTLGLRDEVHEAEASDKGTTR